MKFSVQSVLKGVALLSCFAISGCAMAPLSNSVTARTNGDGVWNADAGVNGNGYDYSLRVGRGVSENLDVGVVVEASMTSSYGGWAKYAFINQEKAWSVAVDLGLGTGEDLDYYAYIGPIVSYNFENFEPYYSLRFNHLALHYDYDVKYGYENDPDWKEFNVNGQGKADYAQHTAGINYWFTPKFGLNANVIALTDSNLETGDVVGGAALLWRF